MPLMPARICTCGKRVPYGIKCECQIKRERDKQAARPSAHKRGYTKEWQKASKEFLALPGNDRCALCGKSATMVDHKVAVRFAPHRRMDRTNWQPICRPCNSRKNVEHEGGFGYRGVVTNFRSPAGDHPRPTKQDGTDLEFSNDNGRRRK